MSSTPKPTPEVAQRVEELLREQLHELGVNVAALDPADIAIGMVCRLGPDNSMIYSWQGEPILHIIPEIYEHDGETSVLWRMFTKDDQDTTAKS